MCTTRDQQGATCDIQPLIDAPRDITDEISAGQVDGMRAKGAIPKKRPVRPHRVIIGANAKSELLTLTPTRVNSPKRQLMWSPETPGGRARKYSIGDSASPSLRKESSGVIELGERYAFPTETGELIDGIKGLNLVEGDEISGDRVGDSLAVGTPRLDGKIKPTVARGKKRIGRAKRSLVIPGQKLITDMFEDKGHGDGNEKRN